MNYDEENFKIICPYCGYKYDHSNDMETYEEFITYTGDHGEKDFECIHCEKMFSIQENVIRNYICKKIEHKPTKLYFKDNEFVCEGEINFKERIRTDWIRLIKFSDGTNVYVISDEFMPESPYFLISEIGKLVKNVKVSEKYKELHFEEKLRSYQILTYLK